MLPRSSYAGSERSLSAGFVILILKSRMRATPRALLPNSSIEKKYSSLFSYETPSSFRITPFCPLSGIVVSIANSYALSLESFEYLTVNASTVAVFTAPPAVGVLSVSLFITSRIKPLVVALSAVF